MLKNHLHVSRLAQDAHIGQHATVHEIVRAHSVASIFAATKLTPLRFFNLTGNSSEDDVAIQFDTGLL